MLTNQIMHFLSMGGYAIYVWPAYAMVFLGFIGYMGICFYYKKRIIQSIIQQQKFSLPKQARVQVTQISTMTRTSENGLNNSQF